MNLIKVLQDAQKGDETAFTDLVKAYQNLSYAYAFSILHDFHAAQDAVQESFILAYYRLGKIEKLEAFPGWLRTIIRRQCYRVSRDSKIHYVSLFELKDDSMILKNNPDKILEKTEMKDMVIRSIYKLPDSQREIVLLYYIQEYSQKEVAEFLGIEKTKVNNHLHAARKTLKKRMFKMAKEMFKARLSLPDDFAENIARIIKIQGSVLEAELGAGAQPTIFDTWDLEQSGSGKRPTISVIQRLGNGRIRCIIPEEPEKLDKKQYSQKNVRINPNDTLTSISDQTISSILETIGIKSVKNPEIVHTGIKIIDLMSPLPKEGAICLLGSRGVGRLVLVMELYKRLHKKKGRLNIIYFASLMEAYNLRYMVDKEPEFPPDKKGPLQTTWLVSDRATDPEYKVADNLISTRLYFSPLIASRGLYPAIDPVKSTSRLLNPAIVDKDHYETAHRVRTAFVEYYKLMCEPVFLESVALRLSARAKKIADDNALILSKKLNEHDRNMFLRTRKLEKFFTQPFHVAESCTKIPGNSVSLEDTIRGCNAILDGEMDDIPEKNFLYTGNVSSSVYNLDHGSNKQ